MSNINNSNNNTNNGINSSSKQPNYTIISRWNKTGSCFVKTENGFKRQRTNARKMAMVITVNSDGKKVTRHIDLAA